MSEGLSWKYGITYFKEANGFRKTENPSQSLTDLQQETKKYPATNSTSKKALIFFLSFSLLFILVWSWLYDRYSKHVNSKEHKHVLYHWGREIQNILVLDLERPLSFVYLGILILRIIKGKAGSPSNPSDMLMDRTYNYVGT